MYTFTKKEIAVYNAAKERHQKEIADLYEQRNKAYEHKENNWKRVIDINDEINKKVEEFNKKFPRGANYLDLHYMTTEGAVNYVAKMTDRSGKKWMIETGQGRHSIDGKPIIKNSLLEIYGKNICVDGNNQGILILDLSRHF